MCPDFFLYLFLSLFVKGIAGKRMVMPGVKPPLNHVSLSSGIPNKGDYHPDEPASNSIVGLWKEGFHYLGLVRNSQLHLVTNIKKKD